MLRCVLARGVGAFVIAAEVFLGALSGFIIGGSLALCYLVALLLVAASECFQWLRRLTARVEGAPG